MENTKPNQTTMPNETVMKLMAEAVAEKVREKIMDDYADVIHEACGDVVMDFLGADAYGDNADTHLEVMMELSGRIAVVAV
jgi:hypothetical protein